jgi:glycosyltransferase involved in cell wall biosynthesis
MLEKKLSQMNENKKDLLSVVMPVHNGERYLRQAIESVLSQTYSNFEFIIVNDGSSDESEKIINGYMLSDSRIRYIKLAKNLGISNALNLGINASSGEYIVRMDCDDLNHPERFMRQLDYFRDSNKRVDVLGTWFCLFYDGADHICKSVPVDVTDLYAGKPPVQHPTCMIRRKVFFSHGFYNSKYDNAEDYELWSRWSSQGIIFQNIPEDLYRKRIHEESVSVSRIKHQVYLMLKINLIALIRYKRPFTRYGYLRIMEQLSYFIYLGVGLDRILKRK